MAFGEPVLNQTFSAISRKGQPPETITLDGYAASHRAVLEMKADAVLPEDTKIRPYALYSVHPNSCSAPAISRSESVAGLLTVRTRHHHRHATNSRDEATPTKSTVHTLPRHCPGFGQPQGTKWYQGGA